MRAALLALLMVLATGVARAPHAPQVSAERQVRAASIAGDLLAVLERDDGPRGIERPFEPAAPPPRQRQLRRSIPRRPPAVAAETIPPALARGLTGRDQRVLIRRWRIAAHAPALGDPAPVG